jgi:hypothetical protein
MKKAQSLRQKRLTFFLVLVLASMALSQVRAQQAKVRLVPASCTVQNVGLTFNLNVTVENVQNLFAFVFNLTYPSDILNMTDVTQGPFLKTGGAQTFHLRINFTDHYNATHGLLTFLCTRLGENTPGVNGNGTLATVTFKSTSTNGPEAGKLHLDAVLSDPDLAAIPCTAADGEVTVIPEFPAALILPLLIASTLVAIALRKRIINHRDMFQSV